MSRGMVLVIWVTVEERRHALGRQWGSEKMDKSGFEPETFRKAGSVQECKANVITPTPYAHVIAANLSHYISLVPRNQCPSDVKYIGTGNSLEVGVLTVKRRLRKDA
ncbi:hypothetical protein GG344DRAFT_70139 [Lentinula edodes]|nr:hypothetical protein GG344DRAFT_70139 [Lentinula edodes]